jgi:hypothetical protein
VEESNVVAGNFEILVRDAERLYDAHLRVQLEPQHANEFVAIEPISGDFFLGQTLSEAIGAARIAHPQRLSHAIRVGHGAALHFGVHLP